MVSKESGQMTGKTIYQNDLVGILSEFGMENHLAKWEVGWQVSSRSYQGNALHFIQADYVDEQCRFLGMTAEMRSEVVAGSEMFRRIPMLKPLLWHCHDLAFRQTVPLHHGVFRNWSPIPDAVDSCAAMFFIYLFLSGIPYTLAMHQNLKIPRHVSVDTMRDLLVWIGDELRKTGQWGLDFSQVSWLGLHFTGNLFQLGRLQFDRNNCYYDFQAFKRKSDGHIVVLAGDGQRFRSDGQFDGANDTTDPKAWNAAFRSTDTAVTGHPLHPEGYAQHETVELPTAEWHRVLAPGDTTIGVHIPGTGPMDFDQCGNSFGQALSFWPTHFPEHRVHAFLCTSWLLDPQFEQTLQPNSNIVRFLREWYLLPLPHAGGGETLRRVFGVREVGDDKLSALSQNTSLERAVVRHIQSGGQWRGHGAVMFPHHMNWGKQIYRQG